MEDYLPLDNALRLVISTISPMISVISVTVENKHFKSYAIDGEMTDSISYKTLEKLKTDSNSEKIKKSFVEEVKRNWKESL